ncbi:MAG: CIA30 family protein [Candidatus Aminicenantes bacterium]|nr:CIA30 family protein [Candidatus Aminicenantes bacterium]
MLKRLRRGLALLFLALVAVAAFNGLTFQKKANNRHLPPYYKKGVFHLHSVFSDGRGDVEAICRDAGDLNLDFVILTDHGEPNLQSSTATAWKHDTLLIGASEFSLHSGHLAAVGYRVPGYVFPPEAQEAIDEVDRDGGVTFISHPFDRRIPWTDWRVRGFTGIEILSLYQMAKKNLLYGLTLFPLQYLLSPDYALTALISYPRQEMETWDRFNREGTYYGIYALDSHAKLALGKKASLHFPSYGATFRILNIYVKVDRELERDAWAAAATIIAALRRGDFFSVIESLAAANGFESYYQETGGRRVEMGGAALAPGGSLVLKTPFAFATDIVVMRDGEPYRTIEDNTRREIRVPLSRPGVYRSEVMLHSGRLRHLPWIMTNPVFVARAAGKKREADMAAPRLILQKGGGYFQVEKNDRSRASVLPDPEAQPPVTRFSFQLRKEPPPEVNFWTALARREEQDLSVYRGFAFEARGDRPLRFWLQFRTRDGDRESAFQHSFLVGEEWRRITIPFARFHRLYGADAPPNLAQVSAFFILVDNGNSFDGAEGVLNLRSFGCY